MMKNLLLLLAFICIVTASSKANTDSLALPKKYYSEQKKHRFYFYWGYNRCAFLKSDIHFKGENYDFTLYDVKAKERPEPFSLGVYFHIEKITIPQYNYRIGFFLSKNVGISLGLDHMKYVVVQNQTVKMSGSVSTAASKKYAGIYDNKDIQLSEDVLTFEHTDGLNLLSLDMERLYSIQNFAKNSLRLSGQLGGGAGIVIPRTDVTVFGYGLDNRFHRAGWGVSSKAALKLDIRKHFFLQTEVRAGFVNLNNILIHNDAPDRASQHIYFGEWYFIGGWYF